MERRPAQFTLRAIAVATFWMGACFAALRLANSGIVPSLYFVLAVLSLCAAVYVLFKDSPAKRTAFTSRAFIAAFVVWNLPVWPLMLVYPNTIGQLVHVAYKGLFGETPAGYGAYHWVVFVVGYASITLPGTLVSLRLFDGILRQPWRWRRSAITITIWETLVVLVLIGSYETGFPYELNQVGWAIFGPPGDVYSFQNLVLHRAIAWFIETTPVAWTSLWVHSRLP